MSGAQTCPRCRTGDILAILRLPHTWENATGKRVSVRSDLLLCSHCDAHDPLTGPIVTYFALHETVRPEHMHHLARLLRRWIDHASIPKPNEKPLTTEAEAWYRGDL
ncbi:hypothetical protein SAMN05421505_13743 [Sinosporangium album]|uniref:Uncharacterized protein n=1 Tax=Sinosporangium album TaxID=504805 RepID=A0A1G8IIU4_9ACTN|nr:DUF6300 family protein [Sinosporangium album]SDI18752.1 hypothetical protein SAMN05421505_13743 [Sinosporangium album]